VSDLYIEEIYYFEKGDRVLVDLSDPEWKELPGKVLESQRFEWEKVKIKLDTGVEIEVEPRDISLDE